MHNWYMLQEWLDTYIVDIPNTCFVDFDAHEIELFISEAQLYLLNMHHVDFIIIACYTIVSGSNYLVAGHSVDLVINRDSLV